MWTIETATLERPMPGKGDDRVFADMGSGVFAVFDGAANDHASSMALKILDQVVHDDQSFDVALAMNSIQRAVHRTYSGLFLTTASLVRVALKESGAEVSFAAAGDSPVFRYDHASGNLTQETVDESERLSTHIDARNFIGSEAHVLKQVGRLSVATETTLLIVSDGITDEFYEGHATHESIAEVLRQNESLSDATAALMASVSVFDDASIVAVRMRPE